MGAPGRISNFPVVECFQPAAKQDPHELILLSGRDLRALLEPKIVVDALHETYRTLASNPQDHAKSLAFNLEGGSAHIKAGLLPGQRTALAAKLNVNLPANWTKRRLPTVQGMLLLSDAITGRPLAAMDSITLTAIRTAATAVLAAKFGARQDAKVAAIIGCGVQARYEVDALLSSYRIDEIRLFDIDAARVEALAAAINAVGVRALAATSARSAAEAADICMTCTTSTTPVLTDVMDLTGCFVAAMGADNPDKSEIDPALMARARIIVDDAEQCASGGDLAHALRAGSVSRKNIEADLCALASGERALQRTTEDLVIFDSCGSGVQDVAAAWLAYRRAHATKSGTRFELDG
jgi:alanine dehydrogenase